MRYVRLRFPLGIVWLLALPPEVSAGTCMSSADTFILPKINVMSDCKEHRIPVIRM